MSCPPTPRWDAVCSSPSTALLGVGGAHGGRIRGAGHLLHHHLRHDVEGGEAGTGEALLVLPHLDGLQPLVHRVKAGVVRDRAVQQRQVDAGGGAGNSDRQGPARGERGSRVCVCVSVEGTQVSVCVYVRVAVSMCPNLNLCTRASMGQ